MSNWFSLLAHASALAYALLGGVFLAFSDFIMRSLDKTSGTGGVEAMQVVNREVFRWMFMTLFLGMAAVSVAVSAYGMANLGAPAATMITLAGLTYLVGGFGVTVVFNVPMNEALARLDPADHADAALAYWAGTYLPRWTFWNSVRATSCVVAAALLLAAQGSTG